MLTGGLVNTSWEEVISCLLVSRQISQILRHGNESGICLLILINAT